jgi:hypothetical protein
MVNYGEVCWGPLATSTVVQGSLNETVGAVLAWNW